MMACEKHQGLPRESRRSQVGSIKIYHTSVSFVGAFVELMSPTSVDLLSPEPWAFGLQTVACGCSLDYISSSTQW
jgi:hypothetical protein